MSKLEPKVIPKVAVKAAPAARSLFAEILDWMLAPLLLVWPLSIILTYGIAENLANRPYDRALDDHVTAIMQQIKWDKDTGTPRLLIPPSARDMLRADDLDVFYFQAMVYRAGSKREFLSGDYLLPQPLDETWVVDELRFRDDIISETPVRIAYMWVAAPPPKVSTGVVNALGRKEIFVLVQVAETLGKRNQLATEIVKGLILPQFIVLPITVLLVWFGLSRGLAPLSDIQARIRRRKPDDMSPINVKHMPEELLPVILAFNDLLARLNDNVQSQKRFVADAAHQLKTPLAGLRMQAELAQTGTADDRAHSLQNIVRGSAQATRLVNQLLALARTEHNLVSKDFVRIDLAEIAREITAEWVPEALARRQDLGLELGDDHAPMYIFGNAVLLREMLKNLIDNALRYSPSGGIITVRVRRSNTNSADPTDIVLEVEDAGSGISDSEKERVLEPFYRVLGTAQDGSGLGLAIVRETVAKHGASLALHDNPIHTKEGQAGLLVRIIFTLK